MIKYEYAFTSEGVLIHIDKITTEIRNQEFKCISCKKLLVPKLGKINRHHFAHRNKNYCSNETYLHRISKHLFYHYYLDCINTGSRFIIEYQRTYICSNANKDNLLDCSIVEVEPFDLTKKFKTVKLEGKFDQFRSDVLLLDPISNTPIFVEFVVNNKLSDKKKNSGYRIIEFKIDCLGDVESFINCHIKFDYKKIDHHNFLDIQKKKALCRDWCKMK